jgi:hypothetical protein
MGSCWRTFQEPHADVATYLESITTREDEQPTSYLARYRHALDRMPDVGLPEVKLKHMFLDGLTTELRRALPCSAGGRCALLERPLAELAGMAQRLWDDDRYERQRTKRKMPGRGRDVQSDSSDGAAPLGCWSLICADPSCKPAPSFPCPTRVLWVRQNHSPVEAVSTQPCQPSGGPGRG